MVHDAKMRSKIESLPELMQEETYQRMEHMQVQEEPQRWEGQKEEIAVQVEVQVKE